MKVKVTRPKKFNGKAITDELVNGVDELAASIEGDFNDVVRTWRNKPQFKVVVKSSPRQISIEATTDSKVFGYLDNGTKVRHALMSRDWVSKTKPSGGGGVVNLSSGGGRGRMIIVSRKINRPGIKARKFTEAILRSNQRDLQARMEKHLSAGVRRSGHGL